MAKKHWIYLKRGLSEDPKHRAKMGECIWLFMHIIDRADWETGIAYNWKDRDEAAEMGMPVETLRDQRQKLEKLDYIRCKQKQHSQDIRIMEWINPRDYSAGVVNLRNEGSDAPQPLQGSDQPLPSNFQGDPQGDPQGDGQVSGQPTTPTLDSESESSSQGSGLTQEEKDKADKLVTAILANDRAPKMKYENRDKFQYAAWALEYCDFYVTLVGTDPQGFYIQVPTKRVIIDWMSTFEEWKQERLSPEHLRAAWEYANRPEGGFPVGRPGALTKTAVAMKSKLLKTQGPGINTRAVGETKKRLEEQAQVQYVPRPASVPPPRRGGAQNIGQVAQGLQK